MIIGLQSRNNGECKHTLALNVLLHHLLIKQRLNQPPIRPSLSGLPDMYLSFCILAQCGTRGEKSWFDFKVDR